jgi:hypothetical protein
MLSLYSGISLQVVCSRGQEGMVNGRDRRDAEGL